MRACTSPELVHLSRADKLELASMLAAAASGANDIAATLELMADDERDNEKETEANA